MAQDAFDFSNVFSDIETKIDNFMKDPATKEAAQRIFADSTGELVYDKYVPTEYQRRVDGGGLGDYRNYDVENHGKLSMTIVNNTFGNPDYAPPASEGWNATFITDIIENGGPYPWRRSQIARAGIARPFMEQALDKFADNYLLPMIHEIIFND